MTGLKKAYVDLAEGPHGWFIDVKALLSDGSWYQWNSWCGEQEIGNEDPGPLGIFEAPPSLVLVPGDKLVGLEKLLLPGNWEKVCAGGRVGSTATRAWIENYLGIEMKVSRKPVQPSHELDIPG